MSIEPFHAESGHSGLRLVDHKRRTIVGASFRFIDFLASARLDLPDELHELVTYRMLNQPEQPH